MTFIAPLVNATHANPTSPMISHLQNPLVRLVSLNEALSIPFSFHRVPEIHDGFQYKLFISRCTSVGELIEVVVDELGLAKTMSIPGGGNLEYVLEEVWTDGNASGAHLRFLLNIRLN